MSAQSDVRLLISDVGGDGGSDYIFTNDEIDAFLAMEGGSVKLAAASALRTMAANMVLVDRRIRFLELSTDGPAEAKALNDLADKLVESENEDDSGLEIAELGRARQSQRNWGSV